MVHAALPATVFQDIQQKDYPQQQDHADSDNINPLYFNCVLLDFIVLQQQYILIFHLLQFIPENRFGHFMPHRCTSKGVLQGRVSYIILKCCLVVSFPCLNISHDPAGGFFEGHKFLIMGQLQTAFGKFLCFIKVSEFQINPSEVHQQSCTLLVSVRSQWRFIGFGEKFQRLIEIFLSPGSIAEVDQCI